MARQEEKVIAGYVKKETMLVFVFVGVVVGFLGGVLYSAFKTGPSMPPSAIQQSAAPQTQQPAGQPAAQMSAEQAQRMLALEREVAANPGNVEAWTHLGHLYFDTDKPGKAISAYVKSLELSPGNADVLTDLGVMYRRNGQPEEAVNAFDKAIAINPRHEQSRYNKGIVLRYDLNDRDGAVAAWEGLAALNPSFRTPNGGSISEAIKEL